MADDRDAVLTSLVAGGGILIGGRFVELAIAFIGKLLIARFFGRVGFGTVSIGLSLAMLAVGVGLLALHTGVGRYLPRYDDPVDRRGVLVSAFQLAIPVLVGASLAIFLVAEPLSARVFDDPSLVPVIRVFAAVVPLAGVTKLAIGASQGREETGLKVLIENLTLPVVRIAIIAGVIILGLGVLEIAWAYVLAYLAAAIIGVAYLLRRTEIGSLGPYDPKRRELLRFSTPLVLMSITGLVLADIDTMLLATLRTTGEVGVYNVVYPVSRLGMVALAPVSFIFMPALSKLHAQDRTEDMQLLYQFVTKWLTVLMLPIFGAMIVAPGPIIGFLFGREFVEGATALIILALGFLAVVATGQVGEVMKAVDRTRLLFYASVLAAVVNVVLNLLLIPPLGVNGAAIATAVAFAGQYWLLAARLRQETGLFPVTRVTLGFLAGGLLVIAAMALAADRLALSPLALVGAAVPVLAGYLAVVLSVAVDRDEIMLLLRFEEQADVDLEPLKRVARLFVDTE